MYICTYVQDLVLYVFKPGVNVFDFVKQVIIRTRMYVDSAYNTRICISNVEVHTMLYYVCYITLRKNPFPKYVYYLEVIYNKHLLSGLVTC